MPVGSHEILNDKSQSLSGHISLPDFLQQSSGTLASPPVLLASGDDDPGDPPTVQEEVSPH
jgi:hypothetical protein